ncbi:MAG: hypothetical protein CFK52_01825 [Chloracidobacterium sp. CP2_5A]|nr:MAG: hypothetical protein CFK52_01825 [Chloracidobacterium sp. CP2_5A]
MIAAALARLGAARANLFPRLALTGSVGRQGTSGGGLTLGAGNFFAFGPSVRLPLLTGGRLRANIAARDAQAEQAARRYEQAGVEAFAEVERALVSYLREGERKQALETARAAGRGGNGAGTLRARSGRLHRRA